MTDLQK